MQSDAVKRGSVGRRAISFVRDSVLLRIEDRLGLERYCYALGVLSSLLTYLSLQVMVSQRIPYSYAAVLRGQGFLVVNNIVAEQFDGDVYRIDARSFRLLVLRCVVMSAQQFLMQYVSTVLPLYQVFIIQNTAPLMIFLLNFLIYKFPILPHQFGFMALSFGGVVLANTSDMLLEYLTRGNSSPSAREPHAGSASYSTLYKTALSMVFLLSTSLYALGILLVKSIKASFIMVNVSVGVAYFVLGAPLYFAQQPPELAPSPPAAVVANVLQFFVFAVPLGVSILCLNYASLRVKDHGNLGLTSFASIVFAILYQLTVHGDYPNLLDVLGMLMVIYGIVKTVKKTR